MFSYTINEDQILLALQLESDSQTVCRISNSVQQNKINLAQIIVALQKFFDVNQVMTVQEPYCDLETVSVHGLVALVFNNLTALPASRSITSFLDTTIKLAADLSKLQAEYQQSAVLTNEQAEEVQSSWDPEPYKSLLAKLYCSSPNPEICDECDAPTDSVSDYRRHLIRDHLGLENWKVLLPEVAAELYCGVCFTQFLDAAAFHQHYRLCFPPCTLEELKLRHQDSGGSTSKFCPMCRRTLCCSDGYARHLQLHVSGETAVVHDSDTGHKCEPDADLNITAREAKLHYLISTLHQQKCEESSQSPTGKRRVELYICKECNFVSKHVDAVVHHMKINHLGLDIQHLLGSSSGDEACEGCGAEFASSQDWDIHQTWCCSASTGTLELLNEERLGYFRSETKESEGIVVGIREELKSLVEKETVLCEDDLNSTDFGELRREKVPKLELTNDQDPLNTEPRHEHVCDICGKVYLIKKSLRIHISVYHNKELNFKCEVCPKEFGRRDGLARHMRVHTKELKYVCEFCSRPFSQSSNLVKHRRIKHMDRPKEAYKYECEVCLGRFFGKTEMLKHIKMVHEKVKDYRCLVCLMQFGGRPNTRRHAIKVHKIGEPLINVHFEKMFDIMEDHCNTSL